MDANYLSVNDIAELYGITSHAVRTHLRRGHLPPPTTSRKCATGGPDIKLWPANVVTEAYRIYLASENQKFTHHDRTGPMIKMDGLLARKFISGAFAPRDQRAAQMDAVRKAKASQRNRIRVQLRPYDDEEDE